MALLAGLPADGAWSLSNMMLRLGPYKLSGCCFPDFAGGADSSGTLASDEEETGEVGDRCRESK